jgi:hypothetical protein
MWVLPTVTASIIIAQVWWGAQGQMSQERCGNIQVPKIFAGLVARGGMIRAGRVCVRGSHSSKTTTNEAARSWYCTGGHSPLP